MIAVLGAETPNGREIAKKLRLERYAVRLMASDASLAEIKSSDLRGIILAGEGANEAPPPKEEILSLGIPVLALNASARALLRALHAPAKDDGIRDRVMPITLHESPLFEGLEALERWVAKAEPFAAPEGFRVIAESEGFPLAYGKEASGIYLLQFQVERNDPDGMAMLLAFADKVCGCTPWWTIEYIVESAERTIREAAKHGNVICAMSGGLDSAVAAMLARRALGDEISYVFVDTGLLREGEADGVEAYYTQMLSKAFHRVDASRQVLSALAGATEICEKEKLIDREIKRALVAEAGKISGGAVFVKGTHHADVQNRGDRTPIDLFAPVVEPMHELFKEEVRLVGEHLGLSPDVLSRQPFPGMGLAARIYGEVTESRLLALRRATALFEEELRSAGLIKRLSRHFAMFTSIGDQNAIILRAIQGHEPNMSVARLPYDLLERAAQTVLKELPGVARVLYDATPGPVEWLL